MTGDANTPPLAPALTPAEWGGKWAGIPEVRRGYVRIVRWDEVRPELFIHSIANGGCQLHIPPETMPALAALCLHERPTGFTWRDVQAVGSAAAMAPDHESEAALLHVARTIANLLAPEKS